MPAFDPVVLKCVRACVRACVRVRACMFWREILGTDIITLTTNFTQVNLFKREQIYSQIQTQYMDLHLTQAIILLLVAISVTRSLSLIHI